MKTRTSLPAALAALTAVCFPCLNWAANEIGYIEKFALAPDREKVLGELVPGSEDYYFFHALHYQNTRVEAKLAEIMEQWKKRFPDENTRRRIIENREALLDYDATPQKTLAYLRERLGVTLNHQREVRDKKPDLPTALDAKTVARSVFERDALDNDESLESLSISALEELVKNKVQLSVQQRRALLSTINRPTAPGLVELLVAELKSEDTKGLEDFAIGHLLLPTQLDALAKAIPSLATTDEFIQRRIATFAPSDDVDMDFDPAEREAWLNRVWAYVKTLPAAQNTLKVQVLYRRLEHDRKKGVYDAARFLEYLKLPRSVDYANPKWIEKIREENVGDLSADFGEFSKFRPVGSDEELVREYFLAIFEQAAKAAPAKLGEGLMAPYTEYVRASWLRPVLAEALIIGGHGNPERWASWITPEEFQELKERVDIEFPETNAPFFQPGEDVQFDVVMKHTPKMLVRVYELNALNFFLTKKRQLNTDLNLDGLVANSEEVHTFDAGPFKRARQTFKFPSLKGKRGAWMIEFIGGGRSSRALLRVGQWQALQQTGPAGDMILVLDEKGEPVKDAVAWLDGRKFTRDEKLDRIVIPFTAEASDKPLIVGDAEGAFATLTEIRHHSESYELDATFHVEREQLLAGRDAMLAVRPALLLGTARLDPALLIEPELTIVSTTIDGISTTREVKDLKLSPGSVLTHRFAVPERLASLKVEISGKIDVISTGKRETFSKSHEWKVNGIDTTSATYDGHFAKFGGTHVYELLGKNGEPIAEQPVNFTIFHKGFKRPQKCSLKTDEKGRVQLGALTGIDHIQAAAPNGRETEWHLTDSAMSLRENLNARVGEVIRIPWIARSVPGGHALETTVPADVSLLEYRGEGLAADHRAKLALKDGFLEITGLAGGNYVLRYSDSEPDLEIAVTDGRAIPGWYLGKHRILQAEEARPIQIVSISADAEVVTIKLANTSAFSRVHVAATRFGLANGLYSGLGNFKRMTPGDGSFPKLPNLYSTEREIGDEYRYILDRRGVQKFAGNMLPRPGLLLNPWAVRDTGLEALRQNSSETAGATAGEKDGDMSDPISADLSIFDPIGHQKASEESNLDFLASSAPVLYNLLPDAHGVVRIDRKALGDRQHVHVYAEDMQNAVWQSFSLPEVPTKFTERRLVRNLDPVKSFSQRRETTVLEKGRVLTVSDVVTGELETYDTLSGIHSLFSTLSDRNGTLAQFAWVLQWPKMKDDEKRAKYDEFACHELNFFLSRKDTEFFDKVIKPTLSSKKDKTFMDDYLLGNDLAGYLEPSAYRRLNAAERALLAHRLPPEAAAIARELNERWAILPVDMARKEQLFETALRGRAMEFEGEGRAFGTVLKEAKITGDLGVDISSGYISRGVPGMEPASPVASPEPTALGLNGTTPALRGAIVAEAKKRAGANLSFQAEQLEKLAELPADALKDSGGLEKALEERDKRNWAFRESGNLDKLKFYSKVDGRPEQWDRNGVEAQKALGDLADTPHLNYFGRADADVLRRQTRAYYRTLGVTKEWAENNYYHLPIAQQDSGLVPVSAFWRDYAKWIAEGSKGAFVSPNVAEASHTFAEMMLALAVLDLPFDAPKHTVKKEGGQLVFTADGPVIIYHKEIKPAPAAKDAIQGTVLVSQSFFDFGDRYRQEGNEKFEKYVTDEFLTGIVYGANVVVTNPTSTPARADVLLQIPQGAMPVRGSKATDSRHVQLAPYTTQRFEYHFYFPTASGAKKFTHFPVNVAVAGTVLGAGTPLEFNVVTRLTQVDKASWAYLSQDGSDADVFTFLEQNNLASLDLTRIAWRCHDAAFFKKLTAFLERNHVWNETIYSYALVHNDADALREWLKRNDRFVSQCGPWLSSKLILLDPIERRSYEHLEYSPLVNQRAHRLGAEQRIANPAVLSQYQSLLNVLAHKPALDAMDNMSLTYHLFLQDRVEEALTRFHSVDAKVLPTKIQHDYFRCYAGFYENDLASARAVAANYADYPIARWKTLFGGVTAQLDEAEGKAPPKQDASPDREKQQSELAASTPAFDFKVENKAIALTAKNLGEVTVNYYLMDPEFAFSSSPFVSQDASRFSIVKPTKTSTHEIPKGKDTVDIPLPAEFATANVLVEVVGAGKRKAQAYHANSLKLTVADNYGRLETLDAASGKPVPKAYVKVYARLKNGTVRFYKDGYTDLRGRFDYASLNGAAEAGQPPQPPTAAPANGLDYEMLKPAEIGSVDRMAILILSETNGATTREVKAPKE